MTPQEKAIDLLNRFPNNGFAKTCAYIAIDEIIESHYYALSGIKPSVYKYWQEVKKEIEKL